MCVLKKALELKVLANLEQSGERFIPLDKAAAQKLASDIQRQLHRCISDQESRSFEIKVFPLLRLLMLRETPESIL